jgi:hypothetical protein
MEGQFKLKAETDIVSVETFYRDLMNPELGECPTNVTLYVSDVKFVWI